MIWDVFMLGGFDFIQMLPSFRVIWLAGPYGSGKTVLATFLAAELLRQGLVARVLSNIPVAGAEPVVQYVPPGMVYRSEYTRKEYRAGSPLPIEDACILMDEAGIFMDDWRQAKDYVAGLRKTNLYFLMPSVVPPSPRLRGFEVRRAFNGYTVGLPVWLYQWHLVNGKTVNVSGKFAIWRPNRLFGISDTRAFPDSDGQIGEMLGYTFDMAKIRENRAVAEAKKKVLDFAAVAGLAGVTPGLAEAIVSQRDDYDVGETLDIQDRIVADGKRYGNGKRRQNSANGL